MFDKDSAITIGHNAITENMELLRTYLGKAQACNGVVKTHITDLVASLGIDVGAIRDCASVLLFRGELVDIVPTADGEIAFVMQVAV